MIVPVILCGGAGTRLWPASREDAPKPFLPLVDGASTFALTLDALADREQLRRPGDRHGKRATIAQLVAAALGKAGVEGDDPARAGRPRHRRRDRRRCRFRRCARSRTRPSWFFLPITSSATGGVSPPPSSRRCPPPKAGRIVVFGIRPDHPSTAFGYIRLGASDGQGAAKAVDGFIEKPDATRARRLIAAGYLWNSGIFLFAPRPALAEIARATRPEIAAAAHGARSPARRRSGEAYLLAPDAFAAAPRNSFDYAVMEKTEARRGRRGHVRLVRPRHLVGGLGRRQEGRRRQRRDRRRRDRRFAKQLRQHRPRHASASSVSMMSWSSPATARCWSRPAPRAGAVKDLVAAIQARPGETLRRLRPPLPAVGLLSVARSAARPIR